MGASTVPSSRIFPYTTARYSRVKLCCLDLLRQVPVRGVVLRDDKQPARVLVNAVHNTRANHAVDAESESPQWYSSAFTSVPS